MARPRVTVLMPVYNGEKYLGEAIESILGQTYRDYEFIIINDGSTDGSADIIRSYKDERVRFIDNGTNIGLPSTLNKGLELSAGEYIVRMDQDDISASSRVEKQVGYMDDHPDMGVCGAWIKFTGIPYRPWRSAVYKYPTTPRAIIAGSLFDSVFAHSSVIMRKSLLERFGLRYDPKDLYAEDYGLWQKCVFCFPLANIPEPLVLYRVSPTSMTNSGKAMEIETVRRINRIKIQSLDMEFSPEELFMDRNYRVDFDTDFLDRFHSWLERLHRANSLKSLYPEPEFTRSISREWFFACYRSTCLGMGVWRLFWKRPLCRMSGLDTGHMLKFYIKCATSGGSCRAN